MCVSTVFAGNVTLTLVLFDNSSDFEIHQVVISGHTWSPDFV